MALRRAWRTATSLLLCLSVSACAAPWSAMPEGSVPTLGAFSSRVASASAAPDSAANESASAGAGVGASSAIALVAAPSEAAAPGAPTEAEQGTEGRAAPPTIAPSSAGNRGLAHRWARTVGWISVAVGAESAVVAGVTSFMLLHQKAVRDRECDAARRCSSVGVDANGTIDSLVGWNTATWIVAIAGIGAGLALVLTHPAPRAPTATLTIAPAPGGAALGFTRTF